MPCHVVLDAYQLTHTTHIHDTRRRCTFEYGHEHVGEEEMTVVVGTDREFETVYKGDGMDMSSQHTTQDTRHGTTRHNTARYDTTCNANMRYTDM